MRVNGREIVCKKASGSYCDEKQNGFVTFMIILFLGIIVVPLSGFLAAMDLYKSIFLFSSSEGVINNEDNIQTE